MLKPINQQSTTKIYLLPDNQQGWFKLNQILNEDRSDAKVAGFKSSANDWMNSCSHLTGLPLYFNLYR